MNLRFCKKKTEQKKDMNKVNKQNQIILYPELKNDRNKYDFRLLMTKNKIQDFYVLNMKEIPKKEKKDIKLSPWDKYLNNITKMYTDSQLDNDINNNNNNEDEEDETNTIQAFHNNIDDYDDEYETIQS